MSLSVGLLSDILAEVVFSMEAKLTTFEILTQDAEHKVLAVSYYGHQGQVNVS